jgi:hypothetical protein
VEHRRLSEPCERRVSRASREKRLAGLIAGQVTDLAGSRHGDPGEEFSRAVERFAETPVFHQQSAK